MRTNYDPGPATYTISAAPLGAPTPRVSPGRTSLGPGLRTSPIMPHATGHAFARDGSLLRVDVMAGRWVATRYTPDHVVTHRFAGTDESVHQQIARWS
jgi:hypothetical protein